jgi:hypothetical protein
MRCGVSSVVAYLSCDQCLRLWAEYGIAVKLTRDSGSVDTAATLEAILDRIEMHESEVHSRAGASTAAYPLIAGRGGRSAAVLNDLRIAAEEARINYEVAQLTLEQNRRFHWEN